MMHHFTGRILRIGLLILVARVDGSPPADQPVLNVALGKTYKFNKTTPTTAFEPNYHLSTDPEDKTQLTDGRYGAGGNNLLWTQKEALAWTRQPIVSFTIDLETIEPIDGISYSTAGHLGNVNLPASISLFVSDDGASYFYAGDLVRLSTGTAVPDVTLYATHRYRADGLETKGRFVRFIIRAGGGGNVVCDEVEIYRGDNSFLELPRSSDSFAANDMPAMEALSDGLVTDARARHRIRSDLVEMEGRVANSRLPYSEKQAALRHLLALTEEIETFPRIDENGFRAVIPFNKVHRRILATNARILRSRDLPPFFAWKNNRYDPIDRFEAPERAPDAPPSLDLAILNGEFRSASFNVTNATDEPLSVSLRIEELPSAPQPEYVTVYQLEYVETTRLEIVGDPLVPAPRNSKGYSVDLPAGLTRQVWLTFNPRDLPAGRHAGAVSVTVDALDMVLELPLSVEVFPFEFPDQPALSLYMWDYANNGYGEAEDAILSDMRAHYVDSAWGNDDVLPRLTAADFDEHGNLLNSLDFSSFDAWMDQWRGRGIRYYLVALANTRTVLETLSPGSKEFNRAVGEWSAAFSAHCRKTGLEPGQVAVVISDEPHSDEAARTLVHWAEAIKESASEIRIMNNPVHTVKFDSQAMLESSDFLCPNLGTLSAGMPKSGAIYADLKAAGKKFWIYSCSGPAAHMDPYDYNRMHAWYAWKYGATGSGFWSYMDGGGSSAWNPYRAAFACFTPVYITDTDVTGGKHWEAVREGVQDYEYFHMLAKRLDELTAQGMSGKAIDDAKQLLEELPEQVAPGNFDQGKSYRWSGDKDRSVADQACRRILETLVKLYQIDTSESQQ
jgi:hypothetical protein